MKKVIFSIYCFFTLSLISAQQNQPNIILINIDDMGWRDVGFMGSEYYETPTIDSLAKAGMIFTQGYASAANCAPSRASMMTGLWSPRHGVYTVATSERGKSKDRKIIPTPNTTSISSDHELIPQSLRRAGYRTIHAGKWHLSDSPLDFGFDVNIGGGHNGHPSSYYPPYGNVELEGDGSYLTDAIMAKTLEALSQTQSPFFLYYSPYAVHTPIQPVHSLVDKYQDKSSTIGQENADYASMVENLDRNIGLLFHNLKTNHQLENTLIIFVSDNGGLKGITSQQPLRSGKGSYYEGGIRVPFFFLWEGRISAGTSNSTPISNLDLYPTILEAVGITNPSSKLDGISLLPMLTGEGSIPERALFWHFPIYLEAYQYGQNETRDPLFRTRPGTAMRLGKWKLHYYFEDNEVELFDLEADISEEKDLSSSLPETTNELLEKMRAWWEATSAPIPQTENPEYIKVN
ncbi:sulfatase [Algoriphagus halophilus]|uniref:Arylsulfatase A n=1 Tax=Algoriphagus halophilus TaxID=226505 RepID=A0A1N6G6Q5_9BACT|nr:sulfatase [Algoriphagus halophilus]SIO03229.1 Arylsulfatase A [Algoriphagus halophilus]